MPITSLKTSLTVIACMQRLLLQTDCRLLYAFTHRLQAMPAHEAIAFGDRAANSPEQSDDVNRRHLSPTSDSERRNFGSG
jgi:hypothetical protein